MTPRWLPRLGLVAGAALLAACATGPTTTTATTMPTQSGVASSAPSGLASTTAAVGSSATGATTANHQTTGAPSGPITIAFGGDVHGAPPISTALAAGHDPLAAVAPLFRAADLSVVNLETSVSPLGTARQKQYVFRAPASLLTALRGGGVRIVSVANNHSFDYGADAFVDTLHQIRTAGLAVIGGGGDAASAWEPAVFDVRGTKVAFVGIARVNGGAGSIAGPGTPGTTDGWNEPAVEAAIRAAKAAAPVVVVVVHWGDENAHCPRSVEEQVVPRWFAAGASVIVGGHPHVQEGIVLSAGHLVDYSVGNLVFYARSGDAVRTGVLTVTVQPDGTVTGWRFDPARIDPATGAPVPVQGAARQADLADLASYAPGAGRCP